MISKIKLGCKGTYYIEAVIRRWRQQVNNSRLTPYACLILIFLLLAGCSPASVTDNTRIHNGVLDLTQWDFNRDGNIKLDGEWEFYWNRLLSHKDIQEEKPDLFADVPGAWNEYSLTGEKLPGEGCATYRLHIDTGLPAGTMLGLNIYTFSSAYNIYINERLVASNGRVAATAAEEVGEYRPQAVIFNIPASQFDIIIQVSNFHYARGGGFWHSMSMGSTGGILALHDSAMGKETALIGALLIIALFYFSLFILSKEQKYSLYFAALCIFTILMVDMVGQFIIPRLLPFLSLSAVIFLWYSSSTWVLFFLILYVHELFPSKISGIIQKAFLLLSFAGQLLYIFTPPAFYTRLGNISNLLAILGVFCTVIIVSIGIKKGNKDGWLNVIGMTILLITDVHDILYRTNIINSYFGEIFYGGLFLFMLLQMVIQANRVKLSHDHKTAAELAFLQAQIKPHFLYNALNTFISISHYDMEKARNLLTDFSHYLRRSFDFKDLSQFVPLKNEIELAKAYVEIEKARFEERLDVNFEVPGDLETRVPAVMLQPLIENAVIHGILARPEGGRIDISVRKEAKMLIFRVKDNGIGMDAEKLLSILKHENGKSVGLANIDKRIQKLYGKGLQIISSPEMGTEITWYIPINGRGD